MKLTNAFRTVENVVLIFSLNDSRSFQGVARMESEPDPKIKPHVFKNQIDNLQNVNINLMANFRIQWLMKGNYPFKAIEHLPTNPLNDNMPIQKSYNGSELPHKLGNYLCYLLLVDRVSPQSYRITQPSKQGSKNKKGKGGQQDPSGGRQKEEGEDLNVSFQTDDPFQRIIFKDLKNLEKISAYQEE